LGNIRILPGRVEEPGTSSEPVTPIGGGLYPGSINDNLQLRGTFNPAELDLFDRVLARLRVNDLSANREILAQRVMANYMVGITDEDELISLSRQPLGR
jgi:hypothetical protein